MGIAENITYKNKAFGISKIKNRKFQHLAAWIKADTGVGN